MLKKHSIISLGLALLICAAAAGCGGKSADTGLSSKFLNQTSQAELSSYAPSQGQTDDISSAQKESVSDEQTSPLAESESISSLPDQEEEPFLCGSCEVTAFLEPDGNLNFTTQLLTRQYQSGQNLLLSPIGLQQALTLAANGAAGQTLAEYLNLLNAADLFDLNGITRWQQKKMQETPEYFKTANSVWIDRDHADHANPRYAEDCREYFQAEVIIERLDNSAVPILNDWVSRHTDHMIPRFVSELPPNCQSLMINTLLFDASWKNPFNPEYTSSGVFHGAKGDQPAPFMHRSSYTLMPWYETDGLQATSIDYNDGRTAMLVALPQDIDSFMAELQPQTLQNMMGAFRESEQYVRLSMPRFTIEYNSENTLSDTLRDMGLKEALSSHGDYSGICEDFAVQNILQKTVLEVGELGTKAAAATGVIAAGSPMPPEVIYDLTLDRPFFCAIYNKETNLVYFAGAVCRLEDYQ